MLKVINPANCEKCPQKDSCKLYNGEAIKCPTPPTRNASMAGTSSKSHKISFRLSNEAYREYERLVKGASNPHETAGRMIKWVAEWYPFRHTTRKYKEKHY